VKRKSPEPEAVDADPVAHEPAAAEATAEAPAAEAPEDRLPWLQRVEEDEPPRRSGTGRLLAYVGGLIVLLLTGWAIAYVATRPKPPADSFAVAGDAPPPLMPAPAAPPAASSSHGSAKGSRHSHPTAVPSARAKTAAATPRAVEKPVRPGAPRHGAAAARRVHETPATARGPSFAGSGAIVQIGAFDSRAAAERGWMAASRKPALRGAPHHIEQARVKGKTVYRLRVRLARGGCERVSNRARGCFAVRR
jgi:hypothetical protein